MSNTTLAERLLSLFTSPDRAAAISGDLTEERHRGSTRFWWNVLGTTLALWRSAVADSPRLVLMLACAGCMLLTGPALGGVAAVRLFPAMSGSPMSWIAMSFLWWGGAFCTGACLAGLSPRRGMTALATIAAAGQTLLIVVGVMAVSGGFLHSDFLFFYTTGLAVAAPLLAGGAVVRRWITA